MAKELVRLSRLMDLSHLETFGPIKCSTYDDDGWSDRLTIVFPTHYLILGGDGGGLLLCEPTVQDRLFLGLITQEQIDEEARVEKARKDKERETAEYNKYLELKRKFDK